MIIFSSVQITAQYLQIFSVQTNYYDYNLLVQIAVGVFVIIYPLKWK